MKKMNYIFALIMIFCAGSTAFAVTEFSDQIKDLTNKIVKSKEGVGLLEIFQHMRSKKNWQRPMTRGGLRHLISIALKRIEDQDYDLLQDLNKISDRVKEEAKDYIQTNEEDELDIINREDAIRKNEHRKKKVQKVERSDSDSDASSSIEPPQSFYLEKNSEYGSESSINSDLSAASDEINPENTSKNDSSSSSFIVSANSAFRKVDQGNTSKNDSNASSTRKSTRNRKINPKYTADCIGC